MLRRFSTPIAQSHLRWIGETYGIADEMDKWCREIVENASDRDRPRTEVALENVFGELRDIIDTKESDWALSARRFREVGWINRLKAAWVLLRQRTPPNKLRVNSRVFLGLSDHELPVEVKTVYEIDLPDGRIVFQVFASYTPDGRDAGGESEGAQPW